jgi:hypothetical protein
MWKNDPFKAKWTIIAKAYSSIRDVVGKQKASLLAFLTLVYPKIGIINAEDYFWKMNWKLEAAVDVTKVLKQTSFPDLSYFGADILYTSKSPTKLLGGTISTQLGPYQGIRYLSRACWLRAQWPHRSSNLRVRSGKEKQPSAAHQLAPRQ